MAMETLKHGVFGALKREAFGASKAKLSIAQIEACEFTIRCIENRRFSQDLQAPRKSVLFICVHNSARSQMAEGLFRYHYGEKWDVYSAGSDPQGIHPMSVQVMAEIGINLSKHRSKNLKEFEGQEMDHVVTVCGNGQDACPFFAGGKKYIHQSFEDPSACKGTEEEKIEQFRAVRDELKKWLEQFYTTNFEK